MDERTYVQQLAALREHMEFAEKQRQVSDAWHQKYGAEMRAIREAAKQTLRAVAQSMRCSPTHVLYLEKGKRHWSMQLAKKYLNAINCSK